MKNNINLSYFLFLGFILFFSITNFYWLKEYRFDQLLDIDEAGYLSYALSLENALKWGGIKGWFNALAIPVGFGPLVPSIASIFMYFGDGSENTGLLTNTILCVFLFITIYQIGLILSGKEAALLSVLFAASINAIALYSRTFNFSISSALFFALAVFSFIKCASFTNRKWSIFLGVSLAFMILSRTMTIAFLPSFFIIFLMSVFFGNESIAKINYKNIILALLSFSFFAIPWYFINFKSVFGYLFSFGYGAQASEYGSDLGIFTLANLSDRIKALADSYGFIQFSILILLLLLVLLKIEKRDLKISIIKKSEIFQISILILLSFFTLFTSRNRGSGFDVPLMAILSTILLSGFFNLYNSFITRATGWVLIGSLYIVIFYSQRNINNCINLLTTLNIPYLGSKVLFDCRGNIHRYIDGTFFNAPTNINTKESRFNKETAIKWRLLSTVIADYIFENDVKRKAVTFASRHYLMNGNTIQLELMKRHGEMWPFYGIEPNVINNSIEGYMDWINTTEKNNSCYIIKLNNNSGEFKPYPNIQFLNSALTTLHYTVKKSFNTPTEGQSLDILLKDSDRCR